MTLLTVKTQEENKHDCVDNNLEFTKYLVSNYFKVHCTYFIFKLKRPQKYVDNSPVPLLFWIHYEDECLL